MQSGEDPGEGAEGLGGSRGMGVVWDRDLMR